MRQVKSLLGQIPEPITEIKHPFSQSEYAERRIDQRRGESGGSSTYLPLFLSTKVQIYPAVINRLWCKRNGKPATK